MNSTAERAGVRPRSLSGPRAAAPTSQSLDDTLLAARRRTALWVGLGVLAAVTGLLVALIVAADRGQFVYVIDDPYIHLSIARNLAQHGSYGVVPGVYESASSSPGWVALLTLLIKAFPAGAVWYPLALNALAAGGVLALLLHGQRFLFELPSARLRGILYALLPLTLFLPALVLLGMEHTLHALLAVALLLMLARALSRRLSRRELVAVAALSLLAGAVRYETLFLVGGAALALVVVPEPRGLRALLGRLRHAEVWAFLLPPLAVTLLLGLVNLHNGQYFLPNSVLAKSGLGAGHGLEGWVPNLHGITGNLTEDLQAGLLIGCGVLYLALRRLHGAQSGLWLAWTVAALLHVGYAKMGWYERYQAYLVISGTLLALRSLPELALGARRTRAALACLLLLAGLPIMKFQQEANVPVAAHVIYQHNTEMGRFLGTAYAGRTILVNDIGEVSWQHDSGGLVDIWALGSYDVLRAYRLERMGKPFVASLAVRDGVRVAAVWGALRNYIPDSWVQVARWSTNGSGRPDADNDLVFYAPDAAAAGELRSAMRAFAPSLPSDVQVLWVGHPAA